MTKKSLIIIITAIIAIFFSFCVHKLTYTATKYKVTKKLRELVDTHDISMQSINRCLNLPTKVWLVSYAGGNDVHFSNQFTLMQSALNKCVNNMKAYNPASLDSAFIEKNRGILSLSRGNGYWLWKPYIILDTLKQIPEGDIVLYVDSGVKIINQLDSLLTNLRNFDILAFENTHTNRKYVKRDLLKIMNMDTPEVLDSKQLHASYLAFRNNEFTRKFVKQWLELCENERALTDIPSSDEYPDFFDHRHDQAIFSLLYLKYKNHFKIFKDAETGLYFNHHRRRTMTSDITLLSQYDTEKKELNVWERLFFGWFSKTKQ